MANDQISAATLSVNEVLSKNYFNVPLYQRPYSWGQEQLEKLWEDLKDFCLDEKPYKIADNMAQPEYFLGPVVIYKEESDVSGSQNQIIDGQQRITTLMLLLHQLYMKLISRGETEDNFEMRKNIKKLLWRPEKDVNGNPKAILDAPALTSEGMSEADKTAFKAIMGKTNYAAGDSDLFKKMAKGKEKDETIYEKNNAIIYLLINAAFGDGATFKIDAETHMEGLINVILNNCKILYVECTNQTAALRIFDTLNNRGMQLRDADIFKAAIYKSQEKDNSQGAKGKFAEKWQKFEYIAQKYTLGKESDDPLNDMFRQLMHYRRAEKGWSKKEIALRTFFETKEPTETKESTDKQYGADLLNLSVFDKLLPMAELWKLISTYKTPTDDDNGNCDSEIEEKYITSDARKFLQVLVQISRNAYWRYMITTYFFIHYLDKENPLDKDRFAEFIKKTVAYTVVHLSTGSGNDFKNGIFNQLHAIYEKDDFALFDKDYTIEDFKKALKEEESCYKGTNELLRALLLLHAYLNPRQADLIPENFQVEHIFAKNWLNRINAGEIAIGDWNYANKDKLDTRVEQLGNKVILEHGINARASDYKFSTKRAYYKKSKIADIDDLCQYNGVWEQNSEVEERTNKVIERIWDFVSEYSSK